MTVSVRVQLNQEGLDRLLRDPNSYYAETYLPRIGNQIVNAAKPRANVDTGLMRSRIEFELDTTHRPPEGRVIARTNYSLWVHNGNGRYGGNPFLTDAARDVMG